MISGFSKTSKNCPSNQTNIKFMAANVNKSTQKDRHHIFTDIQPK
jgi:hypothetical protein